MDLIDDKNMNVPNQSMINKLKKYSKIGGIIVIVASVFVLIGWTFDIAFLRSTLPGFVSMKANTAICFILFGIAIITLLTNKKFFTDLLAFFGFSIGSLSLLEYIFKVNYGIDELIFKEISESAFTAFPGRMAIVTAVVFIFIGISIILINHSYKKISDFFVSISFGFAVLSLYGYILDVSEFYNIGGVEITAVAIPTAILMMVITISLLFISIEDGIFSVLTDQTSSSKLFFTFSSLVLIINPFIAKIIHIAHDYNYITFELAFGLLTIITSFIVVSLLFYLSRYSSQEELTKMGLTEQIMQNNQMLMIEVNARKQAEEKLEKTLSEQKKMVDFMTNRELKMVELKKEIAALKQGTDKR